MYFLTCLAIGLILMNVCPVVTKNMYHDQDLDTALILAPPGSSSRRRLEIINDHKKINGWTKIGKVLLCSELNEMQALLDSLDQNLKEGILKHEHVGFLPEDVSRAIKSAQEGLIPCFLGIMKQKNSDLSENEVIIKGSAFLKNHFRQWSSLDFKNIHQDIAKKLPNQVDYISAEHVVRYLLRKNSVRPLPFTILHYLVSSWNS